MWPLTIPYTGQYWLPQTRFFITFTMFVTAENDVLDVVWLIGLHLIHSSKQTVKLVIRIEMRTFF